MCGIAGKLDTKPINPVVIKEMTDCLVRRGPDAEGLVTFQDKNQYIGFGHRRLKIIDLSDSANQPFISENKQIHLLFNGEIYNYQELRKKYLPEVPLRTSSDTEIILKLYEKEGIACVQKLRGMFAIAIYDCRDSTLYLARDHVGKKPLFYTHLGQTLLFASQLKPILKQLPVRPELNKNLIDDYLNFGYIPTNSSIFQGIEKLPPATILMYRNNTVKTKKFWELNYVPKIEQSTKRISSTLEDLITESVRLRMIADVPLGAFLSGGVDSSLIVALMAQNSTQKVKTFSIGFPQKDFNETSYAQKIAKKYNTEHTEFMVTPDAVSILDELTAAYDEPFADPSQIPMHYLCQQTRQKVTVALNGDGGDEALAGYERYLGMIYQSWYRKLPQPLRQMAYTALKNKPVSTKHRSLLRRLKWLTRLGITPEDKAYLEVFRDTTEIYKKELYTPVFAAGLGSSPGDTELCSYFETAGLDLIDRMLNSDLHTYLPQDLLVKADRASMYHSLETRSPLLDYKVLEYTATLPVNYKINGTTTKYLLKEIASKHIPQELIHRPKQGFGVPLGSWFKKELKTYINDRFHNSSLVRDGLFTQSGLDAVLENHWTEKANLGRFIFTLLMLENWYAKL
jgi:asparagine synthase (glutamine-hydrolysing)